MFSFTALNLAHIHLLSGRHCHGFLFCLLPCENDSSVATILETPGFKRQTEKYAFDVVIITSESNSGRENSPSSPSTRTRYHFDRPRVYASVSQHPLY